MTLSRDCGILTCESEYQLSAPGAGWVSGENRESGENPERYRHCKRADACKDLDDVALKLVNGFCVILFPNVGAIKVSSVSATVQAAGE